MTLGRCASELTSRCGVVRFPLHSSAGAHRPVSSNPQPGPVSTARLESFLLFKRNTVLARQTNRACVCAHHTRGASHILARLPACPFKQSTFNTFDEPLRIVSLAVSVRL